MDKLKLHHLNLKGKKVLMRVDFNVPMDEQGRITDDTRIRSALASIRYILEQGASVILMAHLGNPKGKKDARLSLGPCANALSALLKRPVILAPDCIGPQVIAQIQALPEASVLLLENLRFHPAEEDPSKDPSFAQSLASLGDVYVNEAFASSHRAHSSIAILPRYFPQSSAAGIALQKEVEAFEKLLFHPKHPFYAIVGGAKISSKIGILRALADKVDALFIGGGMAFPFLKVHGVKIGNSLCTPESPALAEAFLNHCAEKKIALYLPVDLVIADNNNAHAQTVSIEEGVAPHWQGVDIGPKTVEKWRSILTQAETLFWNGPLGMFEVAEFSKGTQAIAQCLATLRAITVVGGGDSVASINQLGLASQFTHISTGGGASLEFIEKASLPGIESLSNT